MTTSKWISPKPTNCQICGSPLSGWFYDVRVASAGNRWGILCDHCFFDEGCSLGTGNGQKYDLETLEKVEG